jgi:DNA-binding NarL/FixJ family response regulator
MIRVIVVADAGPVHAAITASLRELADVDIVAFAHGRAPLAPLVRAHVPDVVLLDEMHRPGLALERIAELRSAAPGLAVVGLADRSDSLWVVAALRAGAAAAVPRDLHAGTLHQVLVEAIAEREHKDAA